MSKETFEELFVKARSEINDGDPFKYFMFGINHQQKKIDELKLNIENYLDGCDVHWKQEVLDEIKELEGKVKELEGEVERENKSHNYHCKESQRKNDVIETLTAKNTELEGEVERLRKSFTESVCRECKCENIAEVNETFRNGWLNKRSKVHDKNKTLTAQIELLTRCEYPYSEDKTACYLNMIESVYCQGCKNKAMLKDIGE